MGKLKKENNSCLRSPLLQTCAVHMKHPTKSWCHWPSNQRVLLKNKSCQVLIISMAKRDTVRQRNGLHELDRGKRSYRTRKQKKCRVVQEMESGLQGATQQSWTEWIRLVSQLVGSSSNPNQILEVALSFPLLEYNLNKHKRWSYWDFQHPRRQCHTMGSTGSAT